MNRHLLTRKRPASESAQSQRLDVLCRWLLDNHLDSAPIWLRIDRSEVFGLVFDRAPGLSCRLFATETKLLSLNHVPALLITSELRGVVLR